MPAPSYEEHAPRADLAEIVRCVWLYDSHGQEDAPQAIPPDGCPEFIVHLATPYAEIGAGGGAQAQPALLFAGQLTKPLVLHARGRVIALGVRFQPDGARGFLGRPLFEATDRRLDLTSAAGVANLLARLRSTDQAALWFDAVQDHIAAAPRAPADALVRAAMAAFTSGASYTPGALSERQWQRRFKDRVGLSPRAFQSQQRFRRVFDAIEHPEKPGWVEAALAAGYFDQPQMARDFRRYLGCTASDWARRKIGLAAMLAAPETYKKDEPRQT